MDELSKDIKYIKEHLNRLYDALGAIMESQVDQDKTLVKQEENLREHMRRTALLESQHDSMKAELHSELEPVKSHINQVKGISKVLMIVTPFILTGAGFLIKLLLTN